MNCSTSVRDGLPSVDGVFHRRYPLFYWIFDGRGENEWRYWRTWWSLSSSVGKPSNHRRKLLNKNSNVSVAEFSIRSKDRYSSVGRSMSMISKWLVEESSWDKIDHHFRDRWIWLIRRKLKQLDVSKRRNFFSNDRNTSGERNETFGWAEIGADDCWGDSFGCSARGEKHQRKVKPKAKRGCDDVRRIDRKKVEVVGLSDGASSTVEATIEKRLYSRKKCIQLVLTVSVDFWDVNGVIVGLRGRIIDTGRKIICTRKRKEMMNVFNRWYLLVFMRCLITTARTATTDDGTHDWTF